MSGSPSLPPNNPQELYSQGHTPDPYSTASVKDAYRTFSTQNRPVDLRLQLPPPPVHGLSTRFTGSYQQRPPPMDPPYAYRGPEDPSRQPPMYSPHESHALSQSQSPQIYAATPASMSSASQQSVASGLNPIENQPLGSPKSQRKTKGHVASACVPCKRAHLRCDAQRPCSRCISNGKEEACVDVQHKKRGRPRLRDDRDNRLDSMHPPHSRDVSPRRPLSIHPSTGVGPSSFDDHYQRRQSFRASDIARSNSFSTRLGERASSSESNNYTMSRLNAPGAQEPVAYLTMGLEFVKGSMAFWDMIGRPNIAGRNLGEAVLPTEVEKVSQMKSHFNNEQKRREPNYLPPILGHGSQSIQGLGYVAEDFGRFPLNFQDHLAFVDTYGYARPIPIRAGLAKEGSFYFIVLLLVPPPRQPQQIPPVSIHRGGQMGFSYPGPNPESVFAQRAPFDPIRNRPGEGSHAAHLSREPPSHSGRPLSFIDQGINQGGRTFDATMERQAYEALPYHGMQQESPSSSSLPKPTPGVFQLPPIRSDSTRALPSGRPPGSYSERSNRVNIEGLIETSEEQDRPRGDRR
ncbi:hypothetical protein QQS21_011849 [Conoideocrella luteorostrata]|uniref:Zn(2)-C6 fungal-type domain-containing protein n=1 Tax=Conoideocrella luteorostrata TaxID=1105319 RepID=A0AAJ0CCK0_9HYPO|nr:hypothetical protein QQS21_011849 [Conoideocrella luteorostrata]